MVLDVAAITDQKIAVGLIENGLRDFLIEAAARVPAGQVIVECGSYRGRSTGHLALGSSQGAGVTVHAFDPWEDAPPLPEGYINAAPSVRDYARSETREAFEAHMAATGADRYVEAHQMTGVDGGKSYDGGPVGLLFHDALHRLEDVRDDLKAWLPHMAERSMVVLHDVGDPQFQVEAGAKAAFTRTKALRERWAWGGREIRLWAKQPTKRGYLVVRTTA